MIFPALFFEFCGQNQKIARKCSSVPSLNVGAKIQYIGYVYSQMTGEFDEITVTRKCTI